MVTLFSYLFQFQMYPVISHMGAIRLWTIGARKAKWKDVASG